MNKHTYTLTNEVTGWGVTTKLGYTWSTSSLDIPDVLFMQPALYCWTYLFVHWAFYYFWWYLKFLPVCLPFLLIFFSKISNYVLSNSHFVLPVFVISRTWNFLFSSLENMPCLEALIFCFSFDWQQTSYRKQSFIIVLETK